MMAACRCVLRLGHATRRLRRVGELRVQLLRQSSHCSSLLRRVRPDGAVRSCQRRRRCSHETPRG